MRDFIHLEPFMINMNYMIKVQLRILKAIGERQSVLVVGDWESDFINAIKEKENIVLLSSSIAGLSENSFTKVLINYENIDKTIFYDEVRKLLLPTGMLIVTALRELSFFEKLFNNNTLNKSKFLIKPKVLQDEIHDNGFLIDGYYGYPGGYLLMMATITNKEVSTLFNSNKQEVTKNAKQPI